MVIPVVGPHQRMNEIQMRTQKKKIEKLEEFVWRNKLLLVLI